MAIPPGAVAAILAKDLRTFARDRFYVMVSVLGLISYVAVFWLLPSTAQETIPVGVHFPDGSLILRAALAGATDTQGFELRIYRSSAELAAAVREGEGITAGLDFPPGFLRAAAAGKETTVRVFLSGDAPEGLRPALAGAVRELAYGVAGREPPVRLPTLDEAVLGPDLTGAQLSLRERMRPLLLFLILLVEMFALAALVAMEISQRTITAILATPATVSSVLAAKAVLGTALAFTQALLLAAVTGSLATSPGPLITALFLGAVLVTGCGLIAGASGRDFVGIVFWSLLFVIPLMIPALSTLFPGAAPGWVRALPSYGLVESIVSTTTHGASWGRAAEHLVTLAAWCVIVLGAGVFVLSRRVVRVAA